jgi:DNA-binding CsgD family transcriptional regulator
LDESQAAAPALRVEAQHMRARVEMWRGAENKAHDLLVTEAAGIEESDPAKAAIMLTDAVMLAIARADVHVALATATAARKAGERAGGAIEALTRVALATVEILRGESQAGIELAAVSEAFQAEADPGVPAHQLILFAGSALVWIEEYERARRLLGQIVQRARAASAPGELPLVLAALADLDYRTGRWPAAYAGATEAVRLAGDTRQTAVVPYALTCVARIAAAQGREDDCRAHAERALELAGAIGAGSTPVLARSALGLLELGLGHPREAIGELEQVARMSEELGVGEPGVAQWGPDLIEAYVRSGDVERAQQALDRFNSEAERTARVWALAAAARCRGLLAPEDEFEEAFQAAFELHSRTPTPFERARSELAFGERLRRARRRADAREWLRRALETFQSLGAPVWMDRAHTELHASGETVRRREGVPLTDLTPQELQVALLVGEGATNREVGAALFLSPKTVEAHLSRIYRKLSIRSRTELARLVASEDAVVAPS